MKRSEATGRLHWPHDGVAIRLPPRRVAMNAAGSVERVSVSCDVIAFSGTRAEPARVVAWDALASALPRGTRVVLLVAAEDVTFTSADVPPLSGLRLREALPNLVEDQTVGDVGGLHVALGHDDGTGDRFDEKRGDGKRARGNRMLAVIDRHWLAAMQVDVLRAGHRVAAIVPESLAVPLAEGAWSLAAVGATGGSASRCWLRSGVQQAIPLSDNLPSAIATATALLRQVTGTARPRQLDLYATSASKEGAAIGAGVDARTIGEALASSLAVPLHDAGGDPFVEWLARRGPEGAYGAPMSLLAFDRAEGGAQWARWRIAAALVVAIVAVQIIGMQWQWAGLKREARALRDEQNKSLTTAFPDTRVVLDAPLQMTRNLAALRASSGRSDPADFSMMMAASARIFAGLPSNALRGTDYEARALRLRFAPGLASGPDERERLIAQALQEGYVLRWDGTQSGGQAQGASATGESIASLKTKGGV